MLLYWILVAPYRALNPFYGRRPLASQVLRSYLRQRSHPSWTSYFVAYRDVQDDNFGAKHFNFEVDGQNYHILRVGCFPFLKYHCTRRPLQSLSFEDAAFRAITVANLGLPCLAYGIAAIGLIQHTEQAILPDGRAVTIHFLIKEDHS